jgi:3,4-dihydroxy 2-butanone 4-phosphate synthase/GTP cyclohydrolase II
MIDELNLEAMTEQNTEAFETAFTVSVDAHHKFGVTTGISPFDRAKTIEVLVNPLTKPQDLVKPGHVFPLRAVEGGVLRRAGHTEAAVDLAKLAGLKPAAVICEIISENGQMARVKDLFDFAQKHGLKIITIADLIKYRLKSENLVKKIVSTVLPTRLGKFNLYAYEDILKNEHHLALVQGKISSKSNILVRVHSQCLTGDVFSSQRCDCGEQLEKSLEMISHEKCGILLYMRQEGRGIGLLNKLKTYQLQDQGKDTVEANKILGFPADLRDYGIGAQILRDLGVKSLRLITNNPYKVVGLEGYGLKIVERIPLEVKPNVHNIKYLKTKSEKMGHLLRI